MVYHNKCCVPHCKSISKIRHTFPNPNKDRDRFNKWIQSINNLELMGMDPKKVYKSRRLCHQHFEAKYISSWSHKLFANAVPTLNITNLSSTSSDSMYDIPSTSTKSIQEISSTGPPKPDDIIVDILESNNSSDSIKGNTGNALLTPYQLLKKTGIAKHTITPKKKKMYDAIKQLNKKYNMERNKKKSFRRRLFEAEQFSRKHHLEENVAKLNSMASMLIQCQLREYKKSKKLRRFTLNEKLLALILYKQSAKSYSVLSKIFILPSKSTLMRLLAEIVGGPGINDVVFDSIQELTANMDSSEKCIAILFDEMAIMPSLHFNEHSGLIEGFEDVGENRGSCLADHVLVFMIRGLKKQWKAPISYHFSSKGGATALQIKQLLIVIIQKLINIGLKPITVICDQNNSSVINKLIQDTKEQYLRRGNIDRYRNGSFEVGNFKVYPIFDPPHLLKGLRNNLIKKDLCYTKGNIKKTAKWKHIERLYESDNGAVDGLRVLPHLSDEHIYENKLKKMKVKHAAQIFSQRLAATLRLVSQLDTEGRCGEKVEETAELLYFFDRLFDSVNGSNKLPDHGKCLRAGLTDASDHLDFWNKEALPILHTMQFQRRSSREQARPPSLKNWSFTINNIKSIWGVLKSEGFSYLLTRRLNQDPLENAFGQLRSFGAQNTNPTSNQFVGNFKILLFNTALSFYKNSFNCEDDKCDSMIISIKKLFVNKNNSSTNDGSVSNTLECAELTESHELTFSHKLHELAKNYVAGYILKKIKKLVTCSVCRKCMFSDEYNSDQNLLISSREYGGSVTRRLCYPTPSFVTTFYDIYKIINVHLNSQSYYKYLKYEIETTISKKVSFEFLACNKDDHKMSIVKLISKFMIRTITHNWCKRVNQIIQGKSKLYTGSNKIKIQANKIRLNRIKKKNTKQPKHVVNQSV